jgi:blue copper oxidase
MRRRHFISTLSASAAFLMLQACRKEFIEPMTAEEALNLKGGPKGGTITRNPLKVPSVVSPSGLTLNAAPATSDLGGGSITNVFAYNGNFPGPTIKANTGDNATIVFQNNLGEPSITHWHGMIVNHPNDGHPMQAIPSGANYSYSYPIIQRACLNWYHPHPHMATGLQVYHGLAGAFIINDTEEAAFNLPSGAYEVPLIVRDATLDKTGNLEYKPKNGGFLGNIPLVNGTKDPYLEVQRAVYRFRILNGANSRIFGLHLGNGSQMVLIGNDGGLLPTSSNQSIIHISNGERLDILIDFRSFTDGTNIMLRDSRSGWDLLEFRVTGNNIVPYAGAMSTSSYIQPLSNPVTTRVFNFQGMNKINGLVYDHNRIDFQVPFGQTELWRFTTAGNAPHPVHVHGASFQVVSRTGGRGQLFPWEAGWKDTVLLENNETVDVLIKFNHYSGLYLLHCHKLEHEDMGMMSNFVVV